MIRIANICLVLILSVLFVSGCDGLEPTSIEYEDIDTSREPLQTPYDANETFTPGIKDGLFTIKPVARYRASVMVAGRESYSYGWTAKVARLTLPLYGANWQNRIMTNT